MKRFKIISILLLLVIFTMILFGSSSFAQETIDKIIKRGTIRVGFCADVPPLKFRDKNGEPAGLCVEWSEALARDLGVELEYVFTDWAGLIPALLSDRSDIIIADVSITLERAKKINYSIPWMDSGMYMAVKKDSEWESWEDMNREDVTIGVNLGGLAELVVPRFFPKAKRSVYNSIAELRIALEQEGLIATLMI